MFRREEGGGFVWNVEVWDPRDKVAEGTSFDRFLRRGAPVSQSSRNIATCALFDMRKAGSTSSGVVTSSGSRLYLKLQQYYRLFTFAWFVIDQSQRNGSQRATRPKARLDCTLIIAAGHEIESETVLSSILLHSPLWSVVLPLAESWWTISFFLRPAKEVCERGISFVFILIIGIWKKKEKKTEAVIVALVRIMTDVTLSGSKLLSHLVDSDIDLHPKLVFDLGYHGGLTLWIFGNALFCTTRSGVLSCVASKELTNPSVA